MVLKISFAHSFGLEFYNLDNQTKKTVPTLHCIQYTLHLILQNLVLKISFTLSFCLGFANHVCQTNKLKTVHTLQCKLYTVHMYHTDQSSVHLKQAKREDIWENYLCD